MRRTLRRPYEDPRIRELLQAANDSARLFRTVFVSFVIVALYLLVIALSADDELLFRDGSLQAPIVNVSVRTSHYFIAAPWLLLLLHFNLLIQAIFLANKIADYERAVRSSRPGRLPQNEMLRLTYPIPITRMSGSEPAALHPLVLWLFVCVTLVLLPVVCLGVIQTQFLDYQSLGITLMHSGALVLDLVLILYLWPRVRVFHGQYDSARVRQVSVVAGLLVATFVAVGPLFSIVFLESAAAGGAWLQNISPLLTSLHSLDVQDKRLYLGAESTSPADACEANDTTLALNLTRRSFRAANLSNSILCSAVMVETQLQRATLVNVRFERADLRDAKMRGAILGNAQFESANLLRADLQDVIAAGERLRVQGTVLTNEQVSVERVSGAQFENAELTGADLRRANLANSILSDAVMTGARLQGAILVNANLKGADLRDAKLQGAILGNAQFERADLTGANLEGVVAAGEGESLLVQDLSEEEQVSNTRLSGARFERADLTGAELRRAMLPNSRFQEAILKGAQLQGAILVNADFEGADLRDAQLQRAILGDARFEGTNLRNANLQDAVAAGEGESLRVQDMSEEDVGNRRLSGAHFERADLTGADLRGANLANSRFREAILKEAQLQAAILGAADLRMVNLEDAVLTAVVLGPARLQGANIRGAQLQGAFLGNAQLEGADLTDAKLQGANLTGGRRYGTIFLNAQLQGANLANGSFHGADMRGVELQGATLDNTQLMGADLEGAELQGVVRGSENPQGGFRGRLYNRAATPSELGGVSFRDEEISVLVVVLLGMQMGKDGASEEVVGDFVRRMFEQLAREGGFGLDGFAAGLRRWMRENDAAIDERSRRIGGAIVQVLEEVVAQGTVRREPIFVEGVYSEEDADRWVGEYLHEVCEAFRGDFARLVSRRGLLGVGESDINGWEEECPAAPSSIPE